LSFSGEPDPAFLAQLHLKRFLYLSQFVLFMRYLLFALLFLSSFSFAWLSGWGYRTEINISNPGSALSDYQVQFNPSIYNNTGLVGSWHFSEGSGTRAADSSGLGNDGTLTNGPVFATGKFGSDLQFDGVNDYVDVGNGASLNIGTSPTTFEFWMRSSSTAVQTAISTRNENTNGYVIQLTTTVVEFYAPSTGGVIDGSVSVLDGIWHHVVVVRAGVGNNRVYVDGVSKTLTANTENLANPTVTLNTKIGMQQITGDYRYFNGSIDEVRIYNRSLSAQEVQEHYNASKARLDYADMRFTQPYAIYETPVTISGTGSNLTDYQVLINITNSAILSHMRSDGADLRFFSSATSTPYSQPGLPYWLESINSSQAKVWVKANVSAGGSTVYLYYGNISASSQGNGSLVFEFFDDFSGDLSKWTTSGIAISGGAIYRDGGSSDYIGRATPLSDNWAIDFKTKTTSAANSHIMMYGATTLTGNNKWRIDGSSIAGKMGFRYNGINVATTDLFPQENLYHSISIMRTGANLNVSVDGMSKVNLSDYSGGESYFGFGGASGDVSIGYDDEVRVRKYASPEPSASIGSESVKSSGNEVLLNHWLEGDKRAWVKVPSISAGASSISMYYGNSNATYNNSLGGNGTFMFFDDFTASDGSLPDSARWTLNTRTGGSVNDIQGNMFRAYNPTGSAGGYMMTKNAIGLPAVVEFDARFDNWGSNDFMGGVGAGTSRGFWFGTVGGRLDLGDYNSYWVSWSGYAAGALYHFRIKARADQLVIEEAAMGNAYTKAISTSDGVFSIGDHAPHATHTARYDNFIIRRYSSAEPAAASGAEQQADTAQPQVQVQSPGNATYATASVPVNFTATDNTAISSCTVRLNGEVNSSACSNYTLTLANGAYTLNVTASDPSGNVNSSQVSFAVSADTLPPGISIQSPENTTYATGAISIRFTATDSSAIVSCIVRLNGTVNSSTCGNYSLLLGNGAYLLNISANDTAGNANSSTVSFTVSIAAVVSNSTTTNSNGLGNVSLFGIPPGASRIVYSTGSSSYSKSFSISSGVSAVRISARATLSGFPASGRTLSFQAS